jgi:DNA-damage-inducible protein J
MAASAMVHVRVDEDIKTQASDTLARMGLSVSDAVRMMLVRIAAENALPFNVQVPNAETQSAMRDARAMVMPKASRFAKPEDMFAELDAHAKVASKKRSK